MENQAAEELARRAEARALIREAFRGVTLGEGVSLSQSQIIDNYGREPWSGEDREVTRAEFLAARNRDVVGDWSIISSKKLEDLQSIFLDFEGFRYYLPARMLAAIELGGKVEMEETGYFSSPSLSTWNWTCLFGDFERRTPLFLELTAPQLEACSFFVRHMPSLIWLEGDDLKIYERRLARDWEEFVKGIR